MKVLMLGWEFPPHISGGLGTACFGLTQGLATHGVKVLFVMPKARGDEDARFVDILGANQVVLEESIQLPRKTVVEERVEEGADLIEREIEVPVVLDTSDEQGQRLQRSFELLEVDSLLRPYSTEREYVVRLIERETAFPRPQGATVATKTIKLRRRIPWRRLVSSEREVDQEPLKRRRMLEFSGGYGAHLMDEVARYALAVEEIARRHEFDVIHAHDWMSVPAGLAAARVSKKPLVIHVHACEHDRSGEKVNREVKAIEQLGLDGAHRIVCVSHYTAGQLRRHYKLDDKKVRVVHNALTQKEQKERVKVEKAIDDPIVLFLGRVTFQKGPDYFLEAASRVIRVRPRVKFVIAGSGDMLSSMIERAARMGLARNVHFTGFLQGEDVERMYAMADVYVMPSVSEPFGISPLEAMALDTPVILSRQSGVSEILRNALKVDFWDVQDMANKILALLAYPALQEQLTDEGREEVRAMRWEHPAGLVRDVYTELVGAR
ncbi:MAG: glycosyltransferase [Planctomycetes bacterium]|nr:glycosyltransferase [Planctomycetota bacterium]